MDIFEQMHQYAQNDADEIAVQLQKTYKDANLMDVNWDDEAGEDDCCHVIAQFTINKGIITLEWEYACEPDSDDIYLDMSVANLVREGLRRAKTVEPVDSSERLLDDDEITASRRSRSTRITAADDDFDTFGEEDGGDEDLAEEEDDGSISDSIDDMADQVGDLQDQIDDVDMDEPSIDIDNNIEGHMIAECDACHGIFISAVIRSDQEIEKISGECPLCGKHSDQYLKWYIKSIEE